MTFTNLDDKQETIGNNGRGEERDSFFSKHKQYMTYYYINDKILMLKKLVTQKQNSSFIYITKRDLSSRVPNTMRRVGESFRTRSVVGWRIVGPIKQSGARAGESV